MKRCIAILIATLVPSAVCAQETASNWPGLAASGLSTVYVLDDGGVETSGKLLRLNPDALVLLVGGAERRFEAARVRRIQQRGRRLSRISRGAVRCFNGRVCRDRHWDRRPDSWPYHVVRGAAKATIDWS